VRVGRWDACAVSEKLVPLLRSLSNTEERRFWGDRATWDLMLGRTLSVVRHCILHGQHAAKAVFDAALGDLVPRLAVFALHHEFAQPELRFHAFNHAGTVVMEYCDVGLAHSAARPSAAGRRTLATIASLPVPQKHSTFASEVLPLARRCVFERELGASVLDHFSYIFCALAAHGGDEAAPLTREHAAVASALVESTEHRPSNTRPSPSLPSPLMIALRPRRAPDLSTASGAGATRQARPRHRR
jgi:hypothetical protein